MRIMLRTGALYLETYVKIWPSLGAFITMAIQFHTGYISRSPNLPNWSSRHIVPVQARFMHRLVARLPVTYIAMVAYSIIKIVQSMQALNRHNETAPIIWHYYVISSLDFSPQTVQMDICIQLYSVYPCNIYQKRHHIITLCFIK